MSCPGRGRVAPPGLSPQNEGNLVRVQARLRIARGDVPKASLIVGNKSCGLENAWSGSRRVSLGVAVFAGPSRTGCSKNAIGLCRDGLSRLPSLDDQ
jgi:hypothetical protein